MEGPPEGLLRGFIAKMARALLAHPSKARDELAKHGGIRARSHEVLHAVQQQELLRYFGLRDAHHLTLRLAKHPEGTFSQGAMFTVDMGNETYAAWLQHVVVTP